MTRATELPDEYADFITACVDMIGRTGATNWELRYDDNGGEGEVVWMCIATYKDDKHEVAAAMLPDQAAFRLIETLCDGSECQHCHRPVSMHVTPHEAHDMPPMICNYVYDQGRRSFVRGCEAYA